MHYRHAPITNFRATDDGPAPVVEGYAAVFNSRSQDLGGFTEIIAPGAFAKTIQEADIRALWNHDSNIVLGRTRANTLELWEDANGLGFRLHPPDTQAGRDAIISLRRGDVDQMSFGFETIRDEWDGTQRTLTEVRLYEISPVTFPAYTATSAHVRALQTALRELDPQAVTSDDLNNLISQLQALLPAFSAAAAPVQVDHPAEQSDELQAHFDTMRRRLEIANKYLATGATQ